MSGDMLQVGDGLVVTVDTAGAAVGATSIPVTATPGPIKGGEVLRKLSDLTGYTIEMRIMDSASDVETIIPVANLPVTVPDQSTIANRGVFNVAVEASDTSSLTGGPFFGAAWRTDSGQHRSLWEGQVNIVDAGGVIT